KLGQFTYPAEDLPGNFTPATPPARSRTCLGPTESSPLGAGDTLGAWTQASTTAPASPCNSPTPWAVTSSRWGSARSGDHTGATGPGTSAVEGHVLDLAERARAQGHLGDLRRGGGKDRDQLVGVVGLQLVDLVGERTGHVLAVVEVGDVTDQVTVGFQ